MWEQDLHIGMKQQQLSHFFTNCIPACGDIVLNECQCTSCTSFYFLFFFSKYKHASIHAIKCLYLHTQIYIHGIPK